MKKLAFVSPWYGDDIPGGAEMEQRSLAKDLQAAGVEVEVLTTCVQKFDGDWGGDYYLPGTRVEGGITVRRFWTSPRNAKMFGAVNGKLMAGRAITPEEETIFINEMVNSDALVEYIALHKPDYSFFVFIPYMFGTTYFGAAAAGDQAILIPCFHDEAYLYLEIFKRAFSQVRGVLYNAQPEMTLTDRVYDMKNVEELVIGIGMDTDITGDGAHFRKKYGLDAPFLLYAGRKDAGKNVDTLLNYFAEYKRRHPGDLQLVLIGGGKLAIPAEIADDVHDLGFVDKQDKYDACAAAALLCQPSKHESFSLVIMESWLCGRPVLVHKDCEVTRHFAVESGGGLYFESYGTFDGAVSRLLADPALAAAMGAQGRAYVLGSFTRQCVTQKCIDFFERLG